MIYDESSEGTILKIYTERRRGDVSRRRSEKEDLEKDAEGGEDANDLAGGLEE